MKTTVLLALMAAVMVLVIVQMLSGKDRQTGLALERIEANQKRLEQNLDKVEGRINTLKHGIDDLKAASIERRDRDYLASISSAETDYEPETSIEPDNTAIDSATIESLQTQLIEINQSMEALNNQLRDTRRTFNRRTVMETWENMQNPDLMTKNITTFAADYSGRIEDESQRYQFEQDMDRLKEMVGKIDDPDLYDYVYNRLAARMESTTDERGRQRLTRMMESLENASDEELQDRLVRYAVFDNMRELRRVAEKYDIPNRTLREYGLTIRRGGRGRPR